MTTEQLKQTKEFREYGYTIVKCPICGEPTLDRFWICDNCGWEFDGAVFPEHYSSANKCTVQEYQIKYLVEKHKLPVTNDIKQDKIELGLDTGFTRGTEKIAPLVSPLTRTRHTTENTIATSPSTSFTNPFLYPRKAP